MKDLLNQFKNWRVILLGVMFWTAIIFGGAECDGPKEFITAKILALALGILVAYLSGKWCEEGKIDWRKENDEEPTS